MKKKLPLTYRATMLGAVMLCSGLSYAQTPPSASPKTAPIPTEPVVEEETVVLSPFEVSTQKDYGYQATETLAGTRIRTNLRDVGAAISVYTPEFLKDVGATDNTTLLQYTTNAEVGGTHSSYAGLGNGTSVDERSSLASPSANNRVRGLSQADNTRDFFVSDIPWDGFNVDRIDVQRGPNSILFGLGKPAGMINASMRSADFSNHGEVVGRFGSYGSRRGSLDVNQVLIDNQLAVRVDGLWDHKKFQQNYTFENDERVYGTLRFDPKLLQRNGFNTSFRAKYEHGKIEANRPRVVPPNDHVSPWFGGMGKLLLTNGYTAEREDTPAVGGDGMGQAKPADPDYNAWISGRGNQQQPFYFMDGTTGQTQRIYGGYMNIGTRNSDGTIRSNSSSIIGQRYSGVFYGVASMNTFATQARLPGYQYGQYREFSITDPSIFNFYDTLIDGPNKHESEGWEAYNVSVSQTGWSNRVGIDLNYDKQRYWRSSSSALGYAPTIDIDYLQNFQDLNANPNVGRPYIQGNGSGTSYRSEREIKRASVFGEFRSADVLDNKFLQKLIGRHRINGVYSGERYFSENRNWQLYATSTAWDNDIGVSLPINDRPPLAIIYLGSSIAARDSAAGANIPGIGSSIVLNDGAVYNFNDTWTNYAVPFNGAWATVGSPLPGNLANVFNNMTGLPTGQTALLQNSNPANYVGWNSNLYGDILRYADGDQSLTTYAAKSERKSKSYAGTWQSFMWDDALIGTVGWRFDDVATRAIQAQSSLPRSVLNLNPDIYTLPGKDTTRFKGHILSWGGVLHLNKLLSKDPLPINISLSYNKSSNFEIADTRRNLYGDVLSNPTGKTKDFGILLSTKDNKYSFRAVKFEAQSEGVATQMSSLNMFGDIISYGLRWRNVFLYNLNAYTLDTANGANEWRYNFDPDTSIGETQDQATVRENASIAAWNDIQAHLPAKFYQYWGFTPPADLANPNPAQVQAYKLWGGTTPQGLTMTSDTISKGYEFEFTANPLPNWRVSFNASETKAVRNNVGGPDTTAFVDYIVEQLAGPAGQMRMFSGGPTAQTLLQQWNSWAGSYTLMKLQEGASSSEIRKWRYNVVTNYTFDRGMLKGFGAGGSYRWQDKVVIGYPVVALTASTYSFDLSHPYYGPAEEAADLWLSYEHKLSKKLVWKIQLNVRNAFSKEGLIPVSVQPDGHTWATVRVRPEREWSVTNTLSF